MRKMRDILRNVNVVNVMLAVAFLLLLNYAIVPTFGKTAKIALPASKQAPAAAKTPTGEKPLDAEPKVPSPADYVVIADQNLFHPDRTIPVDKKDLAAPLPKPEFVLYGTLITDDLHLAYMEDKKAPQNTPGRGKKQIPVKLGESLSGFILKEIDTDKVVMVRGDEKVDVFLNDTTKNREITGPAPAAQQAPTARTPQPFVQNSPRPSAVAPQAPPSVAGRPANPPTRTNVQPQGGAVTQPAGAANRRFRLFGH